MIKTDQIGIASWGMRELELEKQLVLSNKLGAHYFELGIANAQSDIPLSAGPEELASVKILFKKHHTNLYLAATGNDFTLSGESQIHEEIEKVKGVIAICAALQVKYLRVFAGFTSAEMMTEIRFARMIEAFRNVSSYADQLGVILAVETHGGVKERNLGIEHFHSVSTRLDLLTRLLKEVPSNVQFVLDPANLWAVGVSDPEIYYRLLKGRIAYIHLKDFITIPSGAVMPSSCGTSNLDWHKFIREISDFTGPLLIEYETPRNIERGTRDSIRFIESLL